jgi:hypothetical protein
MHEPILTSLECSLLSALPHSLAFSHRNGHRGVIRDCLCFDETVVSGGEDSKLCVWKSGAPEGEPATPVRGRVDAPDRKFKPY